MNLFLPSKLNSLKKKEDNQNLEFEFSQVNSPLNEQQTNKKPTFFGIINRIQSICNIPITMSRVYSKIIRHIKEQENMTHTQGEKQSVKTDAEVPQADENSDP